MSVVVKIKKVKQSMPGRDTEERISNGLSNTLTICQVSQVARRELKTVTTVSESTSSSILDPNSLKAESWKPLVLTIL